MEENTAKLPEHLRPPVETLERFLNVSPEWRSKFLVDLQNDCACEVEHYDVPHGPLRLAYWDNGLRFLEEGASRLEMPMQPGVLTDEIVARLVEFAGLTPELFEAYDLLTYGHITANLGGWGLMVYSPVR